MERVAHAVLAIDPGDEHVGWALGLRIVGTEWAVKAGTWARSDAVSNVSKLIWTDPAAAVDELVLEKFQLYPGTAPKLAYSPMQTSELIGKLTLIAELPDVPVPVVMQSAMIKKPIARQLAARKIKRVGVGSHARDAELHLYYRILRQAQ